MATVARREKHWKADQQVFEKRGQWYTGTNAAGQTITLDGYSAFPTVKVQLYDTTNNLFSTEFKQVTALTGEANGFTFDQATRIITFGDGTDGYKPAAATHNIYVEYWALPGGSSTTYPGYMRVQDGDGTTVADVVAAMKHVVDTGVAKGTQTNTTLVDTDKAWTVDALIGKTIIIHVEAATTETRTITDNDATSVTVATWTTNPVTTVTHYEIRDTQNALCVDVVGGITISEMNVETDPKVAQYKSSPPDLANNQDTQVLADVKGRTVVVGPQADGAAVTGSPVLVGGQDGTNAQSMLTDSSGRPNVVGAGADGAAVAGNPVLVAGQDGTNAETLKTDSTGRLEVIGGAADGAAVAGNPVLIAGQDGTNAQSLSTDATGQIQTAHDANTNPVFAKVTDGSNEVEVAVDGSAAKTKGIQALGTDGTNAQIVKTDATGRVEVIGGAADGAAVAGNPVLIAGQDGTNAQSISTDNAGQIQTAHDANTNPVFAKVTDGTDELDIATDGAAVKTKGVQVMGTDGTNAQTISTDNGGQIQTAHDANTNPIFSEITDGTTDVDVMPLSAAVAPTGVLGVAGEIVDFDTSGSTDFTPAIGIMGQSSAGALPILVTTDGEVVVSQENAISTTTLTWTGDGAAITDKAPDTDTAIDIAGAKSISVQLQTPAVTGGVSTFDCYVISSPDNSTYDDTAYVQPFDDIAESKELTKAVTPGPYYVKLRLTVNTANPAAAENTVAKVVVVK